MNITLLGLLAGVFSTISFLPQIIKIMQTKSTKDISIFMYLLFSFGSILWITYGILISALPVITTNVAILSLLIVILVLKFRYK